MAISIPRDAATVIVARDGVSAIEVYMVRRSSKSQVFPGAYVFPGGAVDPDDDSPTARMQLAGRWRPEEPALTYAAIRETFEECGVLFAEPPVPEARLRTAHTQLRAGSKSFGETLVDLGTRVDATAVHYFARRVTPLRFARRFDVRFFVARLPDGQVAEADGFETHDGRWVTPAKMLELAASNEVEILRPTARYLEQLCEFADVATLLAFADGQTTIPIEMGSGQN
jgi:recombination protein RecT